MTSILTTSTIRFVSYGTSIFLVKAKFLCKKLTNEKYIFDFIAHFKVKFYCKISDLPLGNCHSITRISTSFLDSLFFQIQKPPCYNSNLAIAATFSGFQNPCGVHSSQRAPWEVFHCCFYC